MRVYSYGICGNISFEQPYKPVITVLSPPPKWTWPLCNVTFPAYVHFSNFFTTFLSYYSYQKPKIKYFSINFDYTCTFNATIQWVPKNTSTCFWNLCFLVYLRNHLSYKKLFIIIHILVWKAFRWKNNFSNLVTKFADIFKNAVLPEKSNLSEKIRHFEKFKNFFSWI